MRVLILNLLPNVFLYRYQDAVMKSLERENLAGAGDHVRTEVVSCSSIGSDCLLLLSPLLCYPFCLVNYLPAAFCLLDWQSVSLPVRQVPAQIFS